VSSFDSNSNLEERRCPRCRERKDLGEFAVDRSKASGRKSHCKACDNRKSKTYYEEHREEKLAKMEAYRRARGIQPRGISERRRYVPRHRRKAS
jgi:hypothetical protein